MTIKIWCRRLLDELWQIKGDSRTYKSSLF